jgi:hypothetical protein
MAIGGQLIRYDAAMRAPGVGGEKLCSTRTFRYVVELWVVSLSLAGCESDVPRLVAQSL